MIIYCIGSFVLGCRNFFELKLNNLLDDLWHKGLVEPLANYRIPTDLGQINEIDCKMSSPKVTSIYQRKENTKKKEYKMNDTGIITNILVKMDKKGEEIHEFKGKLVGFIEDDECKALINTVNAAEYVYKNAPPMEIKDKPTVLYGKRLVIITEDLGDKKIRLFISAKINSSTTHTGANFSKKLSVECKDGNKFELVMTG